MTPTAASKALLWVALHWPIGNARVARRVETFARAVPKMAATPATIQAAQLYIEGCGLVEQSPWRAAMVDVLDSLRATPPPALRLHLVSDLARASLYTATPAPFDRARQVAAQLEQLLPQ